jgi:RNA polymerase sigma-B factor
MGQEHWELWRRAGRGDRHARERLIEDNMPLARSLAVQYRHAREPLEDLCQVAMLGLVKAVDRFEPGRGIAFASYAVPTILGELRRHFRDRTWSIHMSRGMQEAIARVERTSETLRGQLGRYPSADEVARACGLSVEEVTEARLAASASRLASLDASLQRDDSGDGALGDAIGAADGEIGRVEDALWLQQIS